MGFGLAICGPAAARVGEQVPIGPRAIGMGGAFSSIADDASALFWNPAGLARVGHQEVMATHADLFNVGLKDNWAAFVLPFAPDVAAGVDWYHEGFDDGELGYSENRVDLAGALKIHPWLWAGVNTKLITRGTDFDGTTIRDTRGFGFDVGLLAAPIDRVRLGLVVQDALDTQLEDSDGVSEDAYRNQLHAAASYTQPRWGTAALDFDDRWHLGFEVTPIEQLALRFGTQNDLDGYEKATWSYGLGVKTGIFRIDYARVDHPTLESTDHFALSMEFNFNPAQVRIEKVQVNDMYTSLYKSYAREPFGTLQLRNLQDRPLQTKLSVYVPELMDAPSEQDVLLRPKASQEVPLTAVFPEKVLAQRGDQPVQVQVAASYQSRRLVRKEKTAARGVAYAPGAIDWSKGVEQAAAFVTPRDPAVDALAREAGRLVALAEKDPFGNRNLSFAAAITDALAELGVAYVPDPNNPYSAISETPHAVDTIHYPYQTLERRSGDCDDTTVLMASLLGNVGVPTRFVDAPGHIFLLVGTGLHERNRLALGVDSTMFVVAGEEVWIPLETTALGKGFSEAWRAGAEEVAAWSARGQLATVDVTDAQVRFEPAQPPGERKLPAIEDAKLRASLARDAATVAAWRDSFFTERYGANATKMVASAEALSEIARVHFLGGDLPYAREQLERALVQAPQSPVLHHNLGVTLAGLDSLAAATDHWRTAIAVGGTSPGLWLNLGLVTWVSGDTLSAIEPLARGISAAGGYTAACRMLGLPPSEAADDSSGAAASEAGTRAQLRAALKRASAVKTASGTRAAAPRATRKDAGPPPPAPHGLEHYLHWNE